MTVRSIVTLQEARDYVGAQTGQVLNNGTSMDEHLEYLIDLCSGRIEEIIQNKVKPQDVTMILDGTGESFIELPYFPVVAVQGSTEAAKLANVQYRTSVSGGWQNIVDDIDLVYFDTTEPQQLRLLDNKYFEFGTRNIRLALTVGWETVPTIFIKQCLERVQWWYWQSGSGNSFLGISNRSRSQGGGNESFTLEDMERRWSQELRDAGYINTSNMADLYR